MAFRLLTVAIALLASIFHIHSASADQYAFEKIAEVSRGVMFDTSVAPSINNHGEVAFFGSIDSAQSLYFRNTNGLHVVVDTFGGGGVGGVPRLNDSGQIAFRYSPGPTQGGLYLGTPQELTPVLVRPYPADVSIGAIHQSISNDGTISFYTQSDHDERIYRSHNGTLELVDAWSEGGFTIFGRAELTVSSNDGAMAYTRQPNESTRQLVRYAHGQQTQIFSLDHILGGQFSGFSINDNDLVAFGMFDYGFGLTGLTSGLYLSDGNQLTKIIDGSTFGFDVVSLNNLGDVAFYSRHGIGIQAGGIFTGPDPVLDKVIETGDALDGRTVVRVVFGETGLNDAGQIAFYAEFADGGAGQFVATPTVPEPSSVALLGVGILILVFCRLPRDRSARARW